MNFISPFVLWFLPLAVLPVLLHLLSRRKYKHVYFSYLGFIQESLKHARRISRLTRLLTLLARTVLLIVLIFLFARPVIHYGGETAESGATAMVILCDISYSMTAKYGSAGSPHGGSSSALELAKEAGRTIVNSKDLSNITAIVAFSDKVEKTMPFTFKKDSLKNFLDGLDAVSRPTNVYPALETAARLLSEVPTSNKVIVILSDLAKHGWTIGDSPSSSPQGEQGSPFVFPSPLGGEGGGEGAVTIVLVDVVPKNAGRENLAVLSATGLIQGGSASIAATVNNFGFKAVPGALLTLKNGEVVLAQGKLNLNAGEKAERSLLVPVSAVRRGNDRGDRVYVEITASDVLDIDNRYYLKPEEFKPLRALVVDGDPGASPAQSETFYISSALSSADASAKLHRKIDYKVVTSAGMIQEQLAEWDVITLANLGEVEEQSASELVRYVTAGGKILISGGDKAECCSSLWSSRFSGTSGLFGASHKVDAGVEVAPGEKVARVGSEIDFMKELKEMVARFEWDQIRVKRVLAVNSPRSYVTWLKAGDKPLLLSWKYGRGELMVFASSIDREWSNMPAKPIFAPFWLEIIRYLGERNDVAKKDDYFNPVEYSWNESDLTPAGVSYITSRLLGTSVRKISYEGSKATLVSQLKTLLTGREMRLGLVVAILLLLGIETYLTRHKNAKFKAQNAK